MIFLEGGRDQMLVSCAIQFSDSYNENLFSYVNNIPTGRAAPTKSASARR